MLGLVGFTTPAEVLVEHKMPRKSFWFVNMKICSPMNSKTHLEPWFIRFNIEEVGLSRVILLDICLILPCLFMMFFFPQTKASI